MNKYQLKEPLSTKEKISEILRYLVNDLGYNYDPYCEASINTMVKTYDTETIKRSFDVVSKDGRCETYNHFFAFATCVCRENYNKPVGIKRFSDGEE